MNLNGDLMVQFGVQSEDSKDMDQECFPSVPITTVTDQSSFPEDIPIKQEPPSPSSSPDTKPFSRLRASPPPLTLSSSTAIHPNSVLKQPIMLAARPNLSLSSKSKDTCLSLPKVNIKLESVVSTTAFSLPPTPPSSNSSDSDGSLSPVHASSHPPSPSASSQITTLSGRRSQPHPKFVVSLTSSSPQTLTSSNSRTSSSSLISSQPKGAVGMLTLTDEEKRTLVAEGYPIPQNLPLSKAEERSLKKIRRKIKNKISAQESRRKKKEYMDSLEKKVQLLIDENCECKKKIESLESSNKSLLSQLQHLQTLVGSSCQKISKSTATQLCNQSLDTRKHKKDDITSCLDLCGFSKYAGR